ncbi:CATRA conflict system CASPASE/TPR repeat-associated protein [Streptomyces sp. NBC_01477]|uniref:CATRA conflict system CASPASE/TPR repeat-associated protein n=1 Tax=Streptomyces sp. NBC_01477 TaxID=2976015 RepID=UPI002E340DC7|nr:CATRA conflict system CASPASE/TPR repeat-associated protein [Streptomyces sp. NBC_01477]
MTGLLDQQLVAHLYAPTDGPDAEAAFRALTDIWHGCRTAFGMADPVPGTDLPQVLPPTPDALPSDGEIAVAAQERRGADCQAVLRRHHDVWNLSVVLAPHRPGPDPDWWAQVQRDWQALTGRWAPYTLGRALIHLARVDAGPEVRTAAASLGDRLGALLPGGGPLGPGLPVAGPLALWEFGDGDDGRAERRFLLALTPDADAPASAWVWSRGDTRIPPLARYLLHAAKLRYQLRVWRRDGGTRAVRGALDGLAAELRRLGADDAALAELLRLRRLEALLLHGDLRELRQTVEIAADNLGRALDLDGLLTGASPFAEDADVARALLQRLDDELAYLDISADRAARLAEWVPPPSPPVPSVSGPPVQGPPAPAADHSRDVFVVHGRDEPARQALFAFLRALGLRPQEWEELVASTGQCAPYLGDTVARTIPLAQAVVVLLTPDDVVSLHPELGGESDAELRPALQPRPNVLLELGMALAVHPHRTLILLAGEQRPVTDLGGRSYVRLTGAPECRAKIASRLRLAGCPVDTGNQDWLTAGDFAALGALRREASG